MRQRVGLAQALIHDPEVLILDEPTIGLDPAQIIEVRKLIEEIGKEKTVLLSTHILSEAQQICDRVLIINRGQLVAEDTPEALQKRLTGTQKVTVHLASDPTPAIEILQGIEDVSRVEINAQNHIILETSGETDIRPKVIATLTAANLEILEVYSETASLEDIFLQLVQEEETERQAQPELEGALQAEAHSSQEQSEQGGENHA
jgi:ABC-2 type transport system ATP-binding protein